MGQDRNNRIQTFPYVKVSKDITGMFFPSGLRRESSHYFLPGLSYRDGTVRGHILLSKSILVLTDANKILSCKVQII